MSDHVTNSNRNDDLITSNLGLVHAAAHRFKGRGIEYDDLYQAGCIGLIKAAESFDPSRGWKFSTYAVPAILGEIKRLFRDGGAIKVGRSLKELSMKATRLRAELSTLYGREPLVSEIAEELGVEPEEAAEALSAALPPMSLTVGEDDNSPPAELDIAVSSPEETVSDKLALNQLMQRLGAEDRHLLQLRYFQNLTQSQTAGQLGMTQVQVSRREKKLLMMLRQELCG